VKRPAHPKETSRARRLRSPLLLALWALLAFETIGGLVLFTAFLVAGRRPGEALHVVVGVPLAVVYGIYQWRHWRRVAPLPIRADHVLGGIAAAVTALTLLTGFGLAAAWWTARVATPRPGEVEYSPWLSAAHNIGAMLILAFVGAHLGAVLLRDRRDPP
jgi:hypothetical protein